MKTEAAARRAHPEAVPGRPERHFTGLGVSAGIAVGPAHVVERGLIDVPEYRIEDDGVEAEIGRFREAVSLSVTQIHSLQAKAETLPEEVAGQLRYLLDAHLLMLSGSRLVRGVEARIRDAHINAEAAIQVQLSEIAQAFAGMEDSYLAGKIDDVREASGRLVRNLTRAGYQAFSGVPAGTIVIAEEITPADTALMDPARIGGFAAAQGGAEGHTAIMARSLGLPAVLGVAGLAGAVRSGDIVAVDGVRGGLVINPGEATIARLERRRRALERRERQLARLRQVPAVSRDGERVTLQCNIELPNEMSQAREAGAEGIGLLRSEFMYMNRDEPPSEDEQYVALKEIVERHGRRAGHGAHPRRRLGQARLLPRRAHLAERQSGAGPSRRPPLTQDPGAARGADRGDPPRRRSRAGAHPGADDHLGRRDQARAEGRGQDDPQAESQAGADCRSAAARRHDRNTGRSARGGCTRRCLRFLLARHQRPHHVHTLAIDRGDEQVAHLYDPSSPCGPAPHPLRHRRRPACRHPRQSLRRDRGQSALHRDAAGVRPARSLHGAAQCSAREAAYPRARRLGSGRAMRRSCWVSPRRAGSRS